MAKFVTKGIYGIEWENSMPDWIGNVNVKREVWWVSPTLRELATLGQ